MSPPPDPETHALYEAADWYARLRGEPSSPALEQSWRDWLAASRINREAWARVEKVCGRFRRIPGQLAVPALTARDARRTVLRGLVLFAILGAGGRLAYHLAPVREWRSEYRTAVGERRRVRLADGSRLMLNTGSAVDTHFDRRERRIDLHAGEILIATEADSAVPARPFSVRTGQGRILALGTRFVVRVEDETTTVTTLERAVEITPLDRAERRRRVAAGQQLRFDRHGRGLLQAAAPAASSWETGRLVVVDQPLADVLAELARYRLGLLTCSPAIAGLRVSGAFPLDDTDEAIAALAGSFPVRAEYFSRYWVRILPRDRA